MTTCPRCGAPNRDNAVACRHCHVYLVYAFENAEQLQAQLQKKTRRRDQEQLKREHVNVAREEWAEKHLDKWEYKVVEQLAARVDVDTLHALGGYGWELVSVVPVARTSTTRPTESLLFFLRRHWVSDEAIAAHLEAQTQSNE